MESLNPEWLRWLEADVRQYAETIEELGQQVIEAGVSRYPVFVATIQHIGLGVPVLNNQDAKTHLNIRLSCLEELVSKGVVSKERVSEFKRTFQDPMRKACFLLISPQVFQFVFLPYDWVVND
jgi:hypothetical protein